MRMLSRQAARRFRPHFPQACPFVWSRRNRLTSLVWATPLSSATTGIEATSFRTRRLALNGSPHDPAGNVHVGKRAPEPQQQLHDAPASAAAPQSQLDQASPVELMHRIKAARSWQQLQGIVDEKLPFMNHLHVSAAVTHMAQLHASSSNVSSSRSELSHGRRHLSGNGSEMHSQVREYTDTSSACGLLQPHPSTHVQPPGLARPLTSSGVPQRYQPESSQQPPPHAPYSTANSRLKATASQHQLAFDLRHPLQHPSAPHQPYHHPQQQHETHTQPPINARTSFLQRLEQAVAAHLPMFEGRQLANTLWAVAKLGHRPSELWLELVLTHASSRMHTFDPQHLANTMYALMLLRYMPPPEWLEGFFAAASCKMHGFGPVELSHLCYAAGKLGLQPQRELLSGVLHHSMIHMGAYGSRELALLVYGFVRMGASLHATWLRIYRRRVLELVIESGTLPSRLLQRLAEQDIQPKLAQLAGEQLAQKVQKQRQQQQQHGEMLQGSSHYHHRLQQHHEGGLQQSTAPVTQQEHSIDVGGSDRDAASRSYGVTSPARGAEVALYLPTVLSSLAEIKHRPPTMFMSTVLAAVGCCAGQFTPVGLTTVMFSLAHMRYRPHPAIFRRVWTLLMDSMTILDTRQCTIALWACATVGCAAPQRDMDAIILNAAARLPEHSDWEIVRLLEAASALRLQPTTSWLALVESDLYYRLPSMRPHEVAALLLPLSNLGYKPHRLWMSRWAEALLKGLPGLGLGHISVALYGAARLGFRPPGRLRAELLVAAGARVAVVANEVTVLVRARATAAVGQAEKLRRFEPTWEWRSDRISTAQLPKTLSRLLWGLAILDMRPDARWLSEYMACLRLVHEELSAKERVHVVWALARLQYEPGAEWAKELALWYKQGLEELSLQRRQQQEQLEKGSGERAQPSDDIDEADTVRCEAGLPDSSASGTEEAAVAEPSASGMSHVDAAAASHGGRAAEVTVLPTPAARTAGGVTPLSSSASGLIVPYHVEACESTNPIDAGKWTHEVGGNSSGTSSSSDGGLNVDALVLQGIQAWASKQPGDPLSMKDAKR